MITYNLGTPESHSWINLLRDLGIFSIASIALKFILDGAANRKLETFKHELNTSAKEHQLTIDANLERYKSEISLFLNQQNKLHEKRLIIIDDMYKMIVTLDSTMREMTAPMKPVIEDAEKEDQERISRAQKALNEYNNYFLYNRLYFSRDVAALLEKIRREYKDANFDYFQPQWLKNVTNGNPTREGYSEVVRIAYEASRRISQDIPKTLEALEDEFRKLLGV